MVLSNKEKKYIILAEDDEDDRSFFKEAFSELKLAYDLRVAEDGFELMNFLEKPAIQLPQLILLDLNMPLINGFECMELIKKNERLKNIPVIIYSTSANLAEIEKSYSLGAHFYLHKPSNFPRLKEDIKKVLITDWEKEPIPKNKN
ncbi:MAG: response regulator [Bacteroidia bacterium]